MLLGSAGPQLLQTVIETLTSYFADVDLDTWIGRGASFEGLVAGELMVLARLELSAPRFSFYGTQAGAEVDLLFEYGEIVYPIEIKYGVSVS